MIRNLNSKSKFAVSFTVALILHAAIIAFLRYDPHDFAFLNRLSQDTKNLSRPLKIDQIDVVTPEEVEKFRRVGVKDGKKNLQRPDLAFNPKITRPNANPSTDSSQKGNSSGREKLSLNQLAPELPTPEINKQAPPNNQFAKNFLKQNRDASNNGHFYFNYKEQKVIPKSQNQEALKNEALRGINMPMNKATDKITNFEIRYERPEGVSEDELNSDEQVYYNFYVRTYQNYYSKVYSTYEKVLIQKPALAKMFDKKHLLIGRVDYDQEGNIITVKILKSSEDDAVAYYFEEVLKDLSQPNPPKIFTKNRKQFSMYYQLHIN